MYDFQQLRLKGEALQPTHKSFEDVSARTG